MWDTGAVVLAAEVVAPKAKPIIFDGTAGRIWGMSEGQTAGTADPPTLSYPLGGT